MKEEGRGSQKAMEVRMKEEVTGNLQEGRECLGDDGMRQILKVQEENMKKTKRANAG